MIKETILKYLKDKRIKSTLLFFIASLLAISTTTISQQEINTKIASLSAGGSETPAIRVEREDDYDLGNRGLFDERRHNENDELRSKIENAKGSTVAVDAGHGGIDCGTGTDELQEKDVNLDVALKLGAKLSKAGIRVIYTRVKDEYVGLNKRAGIANNSEADLFLSVHCNGMENDTSCSGSETLYKDKKSEVGKINSKRFAEIIQSELPGALGTRDNGIIYRKRLAVLVLAKMPAVIAEIGYISNPMDREKLSSEDYKEKAAEALFKGAVKALNELK
jgi:N-acetylmuramoyl-L-alanine amidase